MDIDFLVLKFYNIVEFFKKRLYLIYYFIITVLLFWLFYYFKLCLLYESSNVYNKYIDNQDDVLFCQSKEYGIYDDIRKSLGSKSNVRNQRKYFSKFFQYDSILYNKIFNYYLLLNNFNNTKYDYNIEGSKIWKKLFISTRVLNSKYTDKDLNNDDLPFFLTIYIGNGDK